MSIKYPIARKISVAARIDSRSARGKSWDSVCAKNVSVTVEWTKESASRRGHSRTKAGSNDSILQRMQCSGGDGFSYPGSVRESAGQLRDSGVSLRNRSPWPYHGGAAFQPHRGWFQDLRGWTVPYRARLARN